MFSRKAISIRERKLHGGSSSFCSAFAGSSGFGVLLRSSASLTFVNRRARIRITTGISRKNIPCNPQELTRSALIHGPIALPRKPLVINAGVVMLGAMRVTC